MRYPVSKLRLICQHVPIGLLILIQIVMAYFMYLEYGVIAVLLCPLRTGSIVLAVLLSYRVHTMPFSCLRFVFASRSLLSEHLLHFSVLFKVRCVRVVSRSC